MAIQYNDITITYNQSDVTYNGEMETDDTEAQILVVGFHKSLRL